MGKPPRIRTEELYPPAPLGECVEHDTSNSRDGRVTGRRGVKDENAATGVHCVVACSTAAP